jgi:protein dithiol:quinone oxidoreductase
MRCVNSASRRVQRPSDTVPLAPRTANLLGFLFCAALMTYAYYAEHVLRLEPCPLCMLQRIGIVLMGAIFLVASAHNSKSWGRSVYALLIGAAALATAGVALRHLYVQSLPPGTLPACGAPLEVMLRYAPWREVLMKVLTGSGECAKVEWRLLGLAMPAWVLIAAAGLGGLGVWANLKRRVPVLRF